MKTGKLTLLLILLFLIQLPSLAATKPISPVIVSISPIDKSMGATDLYRIRISALSSLKEGRFLVRLTLPQGLSVLSKKTTYIVPPDQFASWSKEVVLKVAKDFQVGEILVTAEVERSADDRFGAQDSLEISRDLSSVRKNQREPFNLIPRGLGETNLREYHEK